LVLPFSIIDTEGNFYFLNLSIMNRKLQSNLPHIFLTFHAFKLLKIDYESTFSSVKSPPYLSLTD